jgi:2-dehydro-3-deoxy-D-arabinonate dehydratase
MILYRTTEGIVVEEQGKLFAVAGADWDTLLNDDNLAERLAEVCQAGEPLPADFSLAEILLAPLVSQEVWAAGVTYYRSRTARMEESEQAGGSSFYDRVYNADRPELFMKATPHRVRGSGKPLHLRRDSKWIVPEPELTLVITRTGKLIGYTAGNDLSCRDIEGENPLYLPQAKTFDACAGIGPGIFVSSDPLPGETNIELAIVRNGETIFAGETAVSQMKKTIPALIEYLYRDNSFPQGAMLMTGTGIVPPDGFSLIAGDEVRVTIGSIGTLVNSLE